METEEQLMKAINLFGEIFPHASETKWEKFAEAYGFRILSHTIAEEDINRIGIHYPTKIIFLRGRTKFFWVKDGGKK